MKSFNPEQFLILIVDDIRKNLQLLIEILDNIGYGTTFAINGIQALERVNMTKPDLILLDLMMPEMNGLEVCEKIKADPNLADIPIIFLTASNEKEHLIEAFEKGAVDYVTKPFQSPELLARVKTHLQLKHTQDQLRQAYKKMKIIAHSDPLTGVLNRGAIFNFGQQEFERAKRYNSQFAVLMIDLDHFRDVNNTYGHDMGDIVLIAAVKVMSECLRKADFLGRYGGEEFLAILPETTIPGASDAGERIRQAIAAQSFPVENSILKITTSIGVTIYKSEDVKLGEVIKRADLAVYQAKDTGRNRVITLLDVPVPQHLSS